MSQDPAKAAIARAMVASLLFLESAIILALGFWLIILALNSSGTEILPLLGVVLFALLGAGGLFAAAVGYRRGKYFGRAPAVLANLIALGVAKYQIDAQLWIIAIPLAIIAIATLIAALRAIPQKI